MSQYQKKGDYEVGYGKPPKEGQIAQGVVLNPNGRRGKAGARRNRTMQERIGEMLYAVLLEKVDAVVNGSKVRMTKIEVIINQAVNAGTKNSKAIKEVLILLKEFPTVMYKLERKVDPRVTEHGRITPGIAPHIAVAVWADFMEAFHRKEIPPEHIPILKQYFPDDHKDGIFYIRLPKRPHEIDQGSTKGVAR